MLNFCRFCLGELWSQVHRCSVQWSRCLASSQRVWSTSSCVRLAESMVSLSHCWSVRRRSQAMTGQPNTRAELTTNSLSTLAMLDSGWESPLDYQTFSVVSVLAFSAPQLLSSLLKTVTPSSQCSLSLSLLVLLDSMPSLSALSCFQSLETGQTSSKDSQSFILLSE